MSSAPANRSAKRLDPEHARALAARAPARARLLASVAIEPTRVAEEVHALAGLFTSCDLTHVHEVERIDLTVAEPAELCVDLLGPLPVTAVRCVLQTLEQHRLLGGFRLEVAALNGGVRLATPGALADGPGAPPALARRLEELAARSQTVVVSDLAPAGLYELSLSDDGAAELRAALHSSAEASSVANWLGAALVAEPPELVAGMRATADGSTLVVKARKLATEPAARLRHDVLETFRLPSASMLPTLMPGDHLFVAKGAAARSPERGELVAFASPEDPSQVFVKRVIGIAGDRVEIDGARVSVNGVPLTSTLETPNYVFPGPESVRGELWQESSGSHHYRVVHDASHPGQDKIAVTVAAGSVFLLGDNRDNSFDSRQFGSVPLELVKGRVVLVWASFAGGEVRWQRFGIEPD